VFVDEVFAIEKPGSQLNVDALTSASADVDAPRPLSESQLRLFCSFGHGSSLLWTHTLRPLR